jgi:hypothetical protein
VCNGGVTASSLLVMELESKHEVHDREQHGGGISYASCMKRWRRKGVMIYEEVKAISLIQFAESFGTLFEIHERCLYERWRGANTLSLIVVSINIVTKRQGLPFLQLCTSLTSKTI